MSDDWGWDEPTGAGESSRSTSTRDADPVICPTCGESRAWCQCADATHPEGPSKGQPKPPLMWLWLSLALAAVGLVIGAVSRSILWFSVLGWLLSGPSAVLAYGRFIHGVTKVSAMSGYGRPAWLPKVLSAVPVVILVAVAVCAYSIADYIARR